MLAQQSLVEEPKARAVCCAELFDIYHYGDAECCDDAVQSEHQKVNGEERCGFSNSRAYGRSCEAASQASQVETPLDESVKNSQCQVCLAREAFFDVKI